MSRRALIPVAALAAALGLGGGFGGAAPPPPAPPSASAPSACQSTSEGESAVVTVEATPEGPEITSTPVDSQQEADAVVAEAAAGGDLVAAEPDLPRVADAVNDPLRPQQWAHNNVNFEGAWPTANQGTGQVVAVVDSGVHAAHEDLSGQVLP